MSCSWRRHVGGIISWGRNDRKSKIRYPIYDLTQLRYKTYFLKGFVDGRIDTDEEVASSKNMPSSRLDYKKIPY